MDLEHIQSKIYVVRGVKVMLDFDLAEIYEVPTKALKQAVRRNIRRFPSDFMFELTNDEYNFLIINIRSQFVTLENENRQGKYPKYAPFAFTELGATMLSSVLNSEVAIEKSILIIRAFVAVRNLILNPPVNDVKELQKEVRELKQHVDGVFADFNDVNEDMQIQIDNINQTLSVANVQFSEIYQALIELADRKKEFEKPRKRIGFMSGENETEINSIKQK